MPAKAGSRSRVVREADKMCMTLKPNSNRAWLTLSVQCPQEWHCDPPQTGGHSNYDYLATVFSNISHLAEIREVFLDRDKCVLPHLQPYTQSGSLTRRRGIAGLLRNLCFQVGKLNTYTKVNSTLMASVSLIHTLCSVIYFCWDSSPPLLFMGVSILYTQCVSCCR